MVVSFEDFDFVGYSFLTVFQNLSGLLEASLNTLEIKFFLVLWISFFYEVSFAFV